MKELLNNIQNNPSIMNVINAYCENCKNEEVYQAGYNKNFTFAYIILENSIEIFSRFDCDVEYFVYNHHTYKKICFFTYEEALDYLNSL